MSGHCFSRSRKEIHQSRVDPSFPTLALRLIDGLARHDGKVLSEPLSNPLQLPADGRKACQVCCRHSVLQGAQCLPQQNQASCLLCMNEERAHVLFR